MHFSPKKVFSFLLALLSIVGYGAVVFATQLPNLTAPPSGGYLAGDSILDPGCAPGGTDCFQNTGIGWSLTGDAGTDGGTTNFIGTTDAVDFVIKTDNTTIAQFGQQGNIALGSSNSGYGVGAPQATGVNSFAFLGGIASGDYSISAGILGTEASGTGAIAFGQTSIASGAGSMTLSGENNLSSGSQAATWQQSNVAAGQNSTAFGSNNTSNGENSVSFGSGNIAESLSEIAIGSSGTTYTPTNGIGNQWNATDRLFTIGNGTSNVLRSDAFTILKNSKTGIGYDNFETTSSDALLQVNGDILSSSLTSCGILETDSNGLFNCGTLVSPAITLGTNVTTIYSSGLSGANQGDPSVGHNIILGIDAGPSIGASYGNYIGTNAGNGAFGSGYSNFVGTNAGQGATFAANANFIGTNTGLNADNAYYSNFIGMNAGSGATNASNSIFIGYNAGLNDTVNNSSGTPSSILIGTNTSTAGFSNSIALGRSATNTATNQFMIGSTASPIDTTRIEGSSSTQCTITTGTGIACTSDERVKTNIVDLANDTLAKILNVRTVTYNWLANPTSRQQVGFLAQDLEQYFPQLVETDSRGMKSVYYAQMTPLLVESLRELNIKIGDILSFPTSANTQFVTVLRDWLASETNGILDIFTKRITTEQVCIKKSDGGTRCITGDELEQLINSSNTQTVSPSPTITTPDPEPETTPTSPEPETTPAPPEPETIVPPIPDPLPESEPEPETQESTPEATPTQE